MGRPIPPPAACIGAGKRPPGPRMVAGRRPPRRQQTHGTPPLLLGSPGVVKRLASSRK